MKYSRFVRKENKNLYKSFESEFSQSQRILSHRRYSRNTLRLSSPALEHYSCHKPLCVRYYGLRISFFQFDRSVHYRRFRYSSSVITSRSTAQLFEKRYVSVLSIRARPLLTPRLVSASLYLSFVCVYGRYNENFIINSLCR